MKPNIFVFYHTLYIFFFIYWYIKNLSLLFNPIILTKKNAAINDTNKQGIKPISISSLDLTITNPNIRHVNPNNISGITANLINFITLNIGSSLFIITNRSKNATNEIEMLTTKITGGLQPYRKHKKLIGMFNIIDVPTII